MTQPTVDQPKPASSGAFHGLVLAGDRTLADPVARAAGTSCKALSPVAGKPMVLWVLEALGGSASVSTRILCGPPRAALDAAPELATDLAKGVWHWVEPKATPSESAAFALKSVPLHTPVLMTTADNVLLQADMVDFFAAAAERSGAELVVALAPYAEVMAVNPGRPRTALRFRDGSFCGCNLFAFKTPAARRAVDFWGRVGNDRKQPWRVVRLLGWYAVLRYLAGRLTLEQALETLSRRLGVRISPVLMPFPEAALDVDTVSDLNYVQARLAREQQQPAKVLTRGSMQPGRH